MGRYSPRTEVKKEKIESHEVTFSVDDEGTWYASAALLDDAVWAKSLQEVRTKVRAKLRRATMKLAIKATIVNVLPDSEREKSWHSRDDAARANEIRHITLTGISVRGGSSYGEVMYSFDESGEKAKKKNVHQSHTEPDQVGVVCRRLTKPEEKEYRTLRDAFDNARDALDAWIKDHRIENVTAFLEEQIQQKIDAEPSEEEPETEDPRETGGRRGAKKTR